MFRMVRRGLSVSTLRPGVQRCFSAERISPICQSLSRKKAKHFNFYPSQPLIPCSAVRLLHDESAERTTVLEGNSSHRSSSRPLEELEVNERAERLSAALESGELDVEQQTSLCLDICLSATENFSWQGLLSITSNFHTLVAGAQSPELFLTLIDVACAALANEKDIQLRDIGARHLITLIAFAQYVRPSTIRLVNAVVPALKAGIQASSTSKSTELINFLAILGCGEVGRAFASVDLVIAVFDHLTLVLPRDTRQLSWSETNGLAICCRSISDLRVRHTAFLTAWEGFLVRQLASGRFQATAHAYAAVKCFVDLRYFAPTFLAAVCSAMADGRLSTRQQIHKAARTSPAAGGVSKVDFTGSTLALEVMVLYSYHLQALPLPPNLASNVAKRLSQRPDLTKSSSVAQAVEGLLHLLPLEVDVLRWLQSSCHQRQYYPQRIAHQLAMLKRQNTGDWVNVLTDVPCPGGRVPIIALLAPDNHTVLPWPCSVQAPMLRKSNVKQLGGGRPVAVLFSRLSDVLRIPHNVVGGGLAMQQLLLREQGFEVFVCSSLHPALRCSSVGDFIRAAQPLPPIVDFSADLILWSITRSGV